MVRVSCYAKEGLKRGRWTEEEDHILLKYIAKDGIGSWKSLPKNAGLQRCEKSCRLRWINYLRSGLKRGNISKEEDETIIKLHSTVGNRWSLIAGQLPGRTDNEIKNYWNSHLSRRVYSFKRLSNGESTSVDLGSFFGGGKRRGGRTRRAAMKKNFVYTVSSRSTSVNTNDQIISALNKEEKKEERSVMEVISEMEKLLEWELEDENSDKWPWECDLITGRTIYDELSGLLF